MMVAAVLFVLSCKDKTPEKVRVQFKGIVMDYFSGTPYPDTKVIIHLGTALDPVNGFSFVNERIDSMVTDVAGAYSLTLDKEDDVLYKVVPVKNGYMQATKPPAAIGRIINADPMTDTLFVGSSASAKFVIKNDIPADSDQVSLVINYQAPGYGLGYRDYLSSDIIKKMGFNPNDYTTTYAYLYDINHSIQVDLTITRKATGGVVITKQTNIYPLANQDTTQILINY